MVVLVVLEVYMAVEEAVEDVKELPHNMVHYLQELVEMVLGE
jgi:hypothetical protein